jgi:hypothetical protein
LSAKTKAKAVSRLPKRSRAKKSPVQVAPAPKSRTEAARPRAKVAAEATPVVRRVRSPRPARDAWKKITDPLRGRKGIRVLFYGITGKGKTHGIADLLEYILDEGLAELVLIHDVKLPEVQYAGAVIHEATAIYTAEGAPEEYPAVRVLRKRDLDHMPSVETGARVTLESGYKDISTIFVIDEFQRALTDGGKFESQSTRRIFCEGLGMHASVIAGKQLPQYTPTEATAQSTVVYFGLNSEGANFLLDEKKVSKEMWEIITALTVTQFLVVPQEGDWDGEVYEVPNRA